VKLLDPGAHATPERALLRVAATGILKMMLGDGIKLSLTEFFGAGRGHPGGGRLPIPGAIGLVVAAHVSRSLQWSSFVV